jgi:ubiquitin-like domain-containing CTD phosphatase 1
VLDVDYTLFDHRSPAENARELGRPFLHEFLAAAYEHYDIVIWSATSMSWIELKMKELGCADHPAFKLCMMFCAGAMIGVDSATYGVLNVKPLGVLWGQFPQYSPASTIMFDDLSRNFLMNPRSGLKIRPCRGMTLAANRAQDDELLGLAAYLELIRGELDLSALSHRHWERALRKRQPIRRDRVKDGEE